MRGLIALAASVMACALPSCEAEIRYIDEDFPGEEPELFARGIVNIPGRFHQNLTMSAAGDEYYFTQTDAHEWRYERILRLRRVGEAFELDTPRFVQDFLFANEQFIGEPMLTPGGDRLFFVADYPPDIWAVQRDDTGDWTSPTRQPFSTDAPDWYVSFAGEDLIFTNGTIQRVVLDEGSYEVRERLRVPFNDFDMRDPVMSSDGRLMIFTKAMTTGQTDLFVTFCKEGEWTKPVPLNSDVNTDDFEFAPYISPDERFLFFARRDTWQNASYSNILWMDLRSIERLAP